MDPTPQLSPPLRPPTPSKCHLWLLECQALCLTNNKRRKVKLPLSRNWSSNKILTTWKRPGRSINDYAHCIKWPRHISHGESKCILGLNLWVEWNTAQFWSLTTYNVFFSHIQRHVKHNCLDPKFVWSTETRVIRIQSWHIKLSSSVIQKT